MNKSMKVLMTLLVVAVVVIGVVALARSELFQGRFTIPQKYSREWFKYKNKIVSPVASPVTSVIVTPVSSLVASKVTSKGGTSKVTSKVTSFVASTITSAVASAVPVPSNMSAGVNMEQLPQLTTEVLRNAAKRDLAEKPARYRLSNEERAKILKMYDTTRRTRK